MQEQLSEILFYVKGTLKYKWVIITVAWLVCISGWIYVSNMPDKYKSSAIVSVDSGSMLRPLLRGMAIQSNTRGMIQVMRQLMFTRPKLEKVAQLANIELGSKTEAQKLSLIEELKKGMEISGGKNDLFNIAYNGENPRKAQNIVHAVLTVFSEQAQQRGINDTSSAQQFIEEQIREYEVRLKNSEKARENFKRVNSGLLPGEGGGQLGELGLIQQQMQASKMALSEMTSRQRVLNTQITEALEMEGEDEWGLDGGLSSQQTTPEDAEISVLTARMNELLLRYTVNHPNVLSIKTTIDDLQKTKQERLANMPDNQNLMSSAAMTNPYIQALKMSLNQVQTEEASLRSRIYVLNKRKAGINQGMDSRLRIETEMQNLERDYSVIKSNYMQLITRREQASMTEKADRSQGILRFKIIEAPNVPLEPTSPNRILLNSALLAAGGIAGLGMAFLIYFIRPSFMSTRQVRVVTGLPVLGSVSVQKIGNETKVNGNIILFWALSAGLLIAYLLAMSNVFADGGSKMSLMKLISL